MSAPAAASRQVAFVGVGRMGSAMLRCVLNAGYETVLYDPSQEATRPFTESYPRLARRAGSAGEAARGAGVIDVVVNTNEQLIEACLGSAGVLEGASAGSIVLVHSTVDREVLLRVAEAATARGVYVLDAMVSGARGHMDAGDLAVMVGGDVDAFGRARPVMETYGGLVLHLGPLGAGLDAKLSINTLRYLCMLASLEVSKLAQKAGVAHKMDRLVAHTASNRYMGDLDRLKLAPLDYRRGDVATARKDLRAAVARAAELGLGEDLAAAEHAIGHMNRVWAVDED